MSTGNGDAGLTARLEDQLLTDIAQIVQGHTAKALELAVNPNIPSSLLAVFEAAANSAQYEEKIEVFNQHLQSEAAAKVQHDDKDRKQRQAEEDWLASMSPEYRQAYDHLMTTVDQADTEYDRMRSELRERGQRLDAEAQDLDDKALHLSDGSRAYANDHDELVDKDGKKLKGQQAIEAQALLQQHGGIVTHLAEVQHNDHARNENAALSSRVDTEQSAANQVKRDAHDHKLTKKQLEHEDKRIQKKVTETKVAIDSAAGNTSLKNSVSKSSFADLDDDATSASSPSARTSFANAVDHDAGIHASNLSGTFNTATQTPQVQQQPQVSIAVAPSPPPHL